MSDTDRVSKRACGSSCQRHRRMRGLGWAYGGALVALLSVGSVSSAAAQTPDTHAGQRPAVKSAVKGGARAPSAQQGAARAADPAAAPARAAAELPPGAAHAPDMPPGAARPPVPPGAAHPPFPPPPFPPGAVGQVPPGAAHAMPPVGAHAMPAGAAHEAPHAGAAHGSGHDGAGHEGAAAHGHDPKAPPPPINWWHGFLGTKKGVEPGLLWRAPDEPAPFLATLFNFAVLVTAFVYYGRKPLAAALAKRKQEIMQGMDEAQRIREEAEQRLRQYEEKFGRLTEEVERVRSELREQGERDKERIVREAHERAAKLRADAEYLLEQELAQIRQVLLAETVDNAVRLAGQLVVRNGTASDHDRFAEVFLAQLKARGGASARRSEFDDALVKGGSS